MPPIPDGYHTITPYVVVTEPTALIEFAVQAFDGVERLTPAAPSCMPK